MASPRERKPTHCQNGEKNGWAKPPRRRSPAIKAAYVAKPMQKPAPREGWSKSILREALPETPSSPIAEAILEADWIRNLRDDWDDDGAIGFTDEKFKYAKTLLLALAQGYEALFLRQAPKPIISPVRDGSIDAFWRGGARELLINIPTEGLKPATYFGRSVDDPSSTTSGTLGSYPRDRGDVLGYLIKC